MLFRDHPPPHFHAGYGRPEALIEIATGRVRLWFTDGAVKDMDLSEALARGGVFEPMYSNRETFELSKRIALSQLCKHAVAGRRDDDGF